MTQLIESPLGYNLHQSPPPAPMPGTSSLPPSLQIIEIDDDDFMIIIDDSLDISEEDCEEIEVTEFN